MATDNTAEVDTRSESRTAWREVVLLVWHHVSELLRIALPVIALVSHEGVVPPRWIPRCMRPWPSLRLTALFQLYGGSELRAEFRLRARGEPWHLKHVGSRARGPSTSLEWCSKVWEFFRLLYIPPCKTLPWTSKSLLQAVESCFEQNRSQEL